MFVKYYLDKDAEVLHQVCLSGEHYCLRKSLPEFWDSYEEYLAYTISNRIAEGIKEPYGERQFHNTVFSTEGLISLSRKDAEHLEDEWCKQFTICG